MERLKTHQENVNEKARVIRTIIEEQLVIRLTIRCSKCETLFLREYTIKKKATKSEIEKKAKDTQELFYYQHVIKCGEKRK